MAVDSFLKLDGIPGDSVAVGHEGDIDIESFNWGLSNSGSAAFGAAGGGGAGKVALQDVHFTARVSKASPKLMFACANGTHIGGAVLTTQLSGRAPLRFMVVTFTDVLVSSFQTGGGGGDIPTDQFSLNYAKVEFDYKPQKPDGTLTEVAVQGIFDIRLGRRA